MNTFLDTSLLCMFSFLTRNSSSLLLAVHWSWVLFTRFQCIQSLIYCLTKYRQIKVVDLLWKYSLRVFCHTFTYLIPLYLCLQTDNKTEHCSLVCFLLPRIALLSCSLLLAWSVKVVTCQGGNLSERIISVAFDTHKVQHPKFQWYD